MNEQKSMRITGCNDHFRCASFGFFALFLLLVPYNKQLNNLDRSVITGQFAEYGKCTREIYQEN